MRYEYDALGNLRKVTLADGRVIEYVVDGLGRRIGKKVDGVLVKGWLYKDGLNPVAEVDGSRRVVALFVYGERAYVPSVVVRIDPGSGRRKAEGVPGGDGSSGERAAGGGCRHWRRGPEDRL